ncbi:shikimate dehydrogenase [Acetobacteraceae bacterium KSS8]|uniref:Shikimate dehydrogenase (NADP(+)) n=1 Tax=Endosaccharibacter trunci TaxID=2812733 RepID=A0ABT1W2T5_9PROT|nr:shikimate dehydrogenase [Acetobacteraceae bacterium KSS8]
MAITGRTRLAGLVGWPVASSRSPLIHNEWLRRAGIDGAYVPLPVAPGGLRIALDGLRAAGFAGVNVTVPHKEDAFRLCDTLTEAARACGAANTLVFGADGLIHGDSSDGEGFLRSLRAAGIRPDAGPALLLGAGGAARAIAASLLAAGAEVSVANRTRMRAEILRDELRDAGAGPVSVLDWDSRGDALPDHALLVNTTTIGMAGDPASSCALDRAPASLAVADIVYVPRETPLLTQARARALRTVEGLGMLLHQAGVGFQAWFGVRPEVDAALERMVREDLAV